MPKSLLSKTFTLNRKGIVIILRFLVILTTFFLSVYGPGRDAGMGALLLVFGAYLASNVALIFVPPGVMGMKRFRNGIFLFDVLLISLIIYLTGGIRTDLYLIYFLIIFMASGGSNLAHAFILTVVVAAIYLFLMARMGFSLTDPGLLIRVPFIFVISFVFLYYAHDEKARMQMEAERDDRLSTVGKMTAEIIHEIKNPLTVILGNAQVLKEADPETARNVLWPTIVTTTQALVKKINGILAFVRSDDQPGKVPVDVAALITSALEICRPQLAAGGIEVASRFDDGVPGVTGHPTALEQVFANLITNAYYALVKGREPGNRKLAVSVSRKGKKVVAVFKDNGPGIKEEDMEKLFTPFFTTKPKGEGTGLGLSICYRIVKDHGGDIFVRRESEPGAVFVIELPPA